MGLRAFEEPSVNAQAVAWQTGQKGERAARVDAILAERGLTADSVRAHAFFKTPAHDGCLESDDPDG